MRRPTLLLVPSLLTSSLQAGVNLKDASYHIEIPLKEAPGLALRYSSRSLFEGLFGRGWCSALDMKIERLDDQHLILRQCDERIPFEARRISRWMASDSDVFESSLSKGSTLSDQIEVTPTVYIRRRNDDTWIFGKDGRLQSVDSKSLKATRSKTKTRDFYLIDRQEGQTKLEIEKSLVRKMHATSEQNLRLLYKDKRLTEILGTTGVRLNFEYDAAGNMTRGMNPRGQSFRMEYDRGLDRVVAVRSGNCVESFEYVTKDESETKGPKNGPFGVLETESLAFESCDQKAKRLKTRMHFTYERLVTNDLILKSSLTETATERIRIHYDPKTGVPTKMERLPVKPLRLGDTLGGTHE